jgi:hypothetical protein
VSDDAFLIALREFVRIIGADDGGLDEGTEVSFEHEGLLAFIFQHPDTGDVVMDVEVQALEAPLSDRGNLARFLLLHQLNGMTRFTHGAQALISADNLLIVTRSRAIAGLGGQDLVAMLDGVLDAALDLRKMWNDLKTLMDQTGRDLQAGGVGATDPSRFA